MRLLARTFIIFRDLSSDTCALSVKDMFDRNNFNLLRRAVSKLAQKEPEDSTEIKYGLKNTLCHVLQNTYSFLKGSYLEEKGREADAEEMQRFIDVFNVNKVLMFGDPMYHRNIARQERLRLPSRMPLEDNLQKLKSKTVAVIKELLDQYTVITKHEFVRLRNAVCSRLTLFNGRRGGEPCRLTVRHWTERKKNGWRVST